MGSGPAGPPPPGSGPSGYGPPTYPPPAYGPPGSAPPGAGPPGTAPGYGYGYGYGAYPPPASNNGLAVASLVCGLLGLFFCQLIGIGAIITGYIARRRIRETGEQGAGLALAGIILGWISIALAVVVILFYVAFGILAVSTASNSSSSTFPRTPTTRRGAVTSTTERIAPTTSTRPPGPTAAPSGVIPVEACPSVTLALKNLEDPAKADRGILTDAARTLHERYPAEAGDDIDTVLADALSRVNHDTTGAKTTEVLEASQRLDDILAAACPG